MRRVHSMWESAGESKRALPSGLSRKLRGDYAHTAKRMKAFTGRKPMNQTQIWLAQNTRRPIQEVSELTALLLVSGKNHKHDMRLQSYVAYLLTTWHMLCHIRGNLGFHIGGGLTWALSRPLLNKYHQVYLSPRFFEPKIRFCRYPANTRNT